MEIEEIFKGIILCLIIIFIGSMVVSTINSISCSNEKAEIGVLKGNLEACNSQILVLNDTIAQCDNRIRNATEECRIQVEEYKNLFSTYSNVFITYNFIFVFWIILSLNLFEIAFKFSLGKKMDHFLETHKRIWKGIKWIVWVIFLIFIILFFYNLVSWK